MKVKELINILQKFDPEMDVVIEKDISEHGFGFVDSNNIVPGVFELTDYGNDFYPYWTLSVGRQTCKALCLKAEDSK